MWTRGSHEIKELKSWGSSKRSEKIGYFGLEMVLEGEWLLVLINSSVWLLVCLAEVEVKKERPGCCMDHPHGYKVNLDDGGTWSRRKDYESNAKFLEATSINSSNEKGEQI